ncbi:MAG TPA: carboxypeptidase-like regulatory domain-containing protein [Acidimicrobiales bacterium]|nr:carboxypeptidase-like regulatory domain-containing protein [Acidimicrobiales bacterium]
MKRGALAAVALAAAVTAACSPRGIPDLPAPPSTVAPLPATTVPDFSDAALKPVPGRTTTTIPMTPGRASLNGTVVGPDGPVGGAIVHVERLVGDGEASLDVATAVDGTWVVNGVLGGRFRVRAWRPQDLALVKPEVFYLSDGEQRVVNLQLVRYAGLSVNAAVAPNPPEVGNPANLVVQVLQQSVDAQGVVRGTAVPFVRVELFGGGDWQVNSANPAITDANGLATWELTCQSAGKQALAVVVGDSQQLPVDLGPCAVPPPTTTTSTTGEPASSSTTTSSTTTSSTSRSSSTTSTTRRGGTTTTTR